MLDDDVKQVESLISDLKKGLKNKDGSPRTEKHPASEKELCKEQKSLIDEHIKVCKICKNSYDSYLSHHNIPMTPPCDKFTKSLKNHIENCLICNSANKKWNEDAIPITPAMRKGVSILKKLADMTGHKL